MRSTRTLILTSLTALLAAVVLSNCAADGMYMGDGDKADEQDPLLRSNGYNNNPMLVPYEGPFDMCFDTPENQEPGVGFGVDLNVARWLSFFAANEYAHYAHFAPILEEMGFGDEGEGEAWVEQGREVVRNREAEAAGEIPQNSSAWFEQSLVQDVIPGKKIQFFAAGEFKNGKFRDESTQMLWVEHRTEPIVIIGFRGTQPDKFSDVVADLNILRDPLPGYGSAHEGFLDAYGGVRHILEEKLRVESGRNLQIWITGHSLGGALAAVASTTIMDRMKFDNSYQLNGVYTFGKPRVGNKEFVQKIEEGYEANNIHAMRFRHGDDMVAQIPWNLIGYYHEGQLMHMDGDGNFDFNPLEQDPGGTKSTEGTFADHAIDAHYHRRISEHLEDAESAGIELSRRCP